jgi:serine protease
VLRAIEHAERRGSLVVAAAGNEHRRAIAYPARTPHALAVGATTERGSLARFSNVGAGLDLVAPGGGRDASLTGDARCRRGRPSRAIHQVTPAGRGLARFAISGGYAGTSMAAPHVAAAAALVIAAGVLGAHPTPAAIRRRLEATARDLGAPGYDVRYGWGLVNAAAATAPGPPRAAEAVPPA